MNTIRAYRDPSTGLFHLYEMLPPDQHFPMDKNVRVTGKPIPWPKSWPRDANAKWLKTQGVEEGTEPVPE